MKVWIDQQIPRLEQKVYEQIEADIQSKLQEERSQLEHERSKLQEERSQFEHDRRQLEAAMQEQWNIIRQELSRKDNPWETDINKISTTFTELLNSLKEDQEQILRDLCLERLEWAREKKDYVLMSHYLNVLEATNVKIPLKEQEEKRIHDEVRVVEQAREHLVDEKRDDSKTLSRLRGALQRTDEPFFIERALSIIEKKLNLIIEGKLQSLHSRGTIENKLNELTRLIETKEFKQVDNLLTTLKNHSPPGHQERIQQYDEYAQLFRNLSTWASETLKQRNMLQQHNNLNTILESIGKVGGRDDKERLDALRRASALISMPVAGPSQ